MPATPPAYPLGRLHAPDPRDRSYPMAAALAPVPTPTSRYWPLGPVLDQGRTSACVGFATRQLLASSPHRFKATEPSAETIYRESQKRDEWDGEAYEGTSARGAMRYLTELGIVSTYRWATSVEEIAQFVLTTGCVMLGINWHTGMFAPRPDGFVVPDGNKVGGHEVMIHGHNSKTKVWTLANSWGATWNPALKGRFRLSGADFAALFADDGDAVAVSET